LPILAFGAIGENVGTLLLLQAYLNAVYHRCLDGSGLPVHHPS
jgi:hypothetical protein